MLEKLKELRNDLKKEGMYKKYEELLDQMEFLVRYIERKAEDEEANDEI